MTPSPQRARHLSLVAIGIMAVCTGSGCATSKQSTSWIRTGDPIVDGRSAIANGPEKDRSLWQCRTALELMRRGKFGEARELLDDALLTIGSSTAGDKEAKKSRGLFSSESRKTFRGEPYERVMAYFYRGIIYWIDGEPDNARACFRNAQIQDSDSESKEYSGDYVLLDYLDGLASVKLASDGSDALKRAQSLSKNISLKPYDRESNILFFIEFGHGPGKYATGEHAEELRFREGKSVARNVSITIDGTQFQVQPFDDLNFQAVTRGGRVMDHILANKAVFKSSSDAVGNVALIGGAVMATNRGTQEAGLGLLAFGLASKIVSAATTPTADVRAWDNLPLYLSFAAARLSPGPHTATINFLDSTGQPIPSLKKTATMNVSSERDTVVFVSDQSRT